MNSLNILNTTATNKHPSFESISFNLSILLCPILGLFEVLFNTWRTISSCTILSLDDDDDELPPTRKRLRFIPTSGEDDESLPEGDEEPPLLFFPGSSEDDESCWEADEEPLLLTLGSGKGDVSSPETLSVRPAVACGSTIGAINADADGPSAEKAAGSGTIGAFFRATCIVNTNKT